MAEHFVELWNARPVRIEQNPEELKVLTLLLQSIDIKNIVEIGSLDGGSLWYWMQICPNAKIISIDPDPVNVDKWYSWQKFDGQLRVIKKKSQDPDAIEEVKKYLNGENIDFLHIDGDHEMPVPSQDFENYSHFVDRGLIVFHDIRHWNCPSLTEYWNGLKEEILHKYIYWVVIEVLNKLDERKFHCPGMGIIIKKGNK